MTLFSLFRSFVDSPKLQTDYIVSVVYSLNIFHSLREKKVKNYKFVFSVWFGWVTGKISNSFGWIGARPGIQNSCNSVVHSMKLVF